MKLVDLLPSAQKTGDILKNKKFTRAIVYSKRFDCFIWCDMDGKVEESDFDSSGYKRVILSLEILEQDGWYLEPIKNDNNSVHKNKVFLSNNGLVIDSEDMCNILQSDEFGNLRMIEVNKRKGTIEYKDNPFMYINKSMKLFI